MPLGYRDSHLQHAAPAAMLGILGNSCGASALTYALIKKWIRVVSGLGALSWLPLIMNSCVLLTDQAHFESRQTHYSFKVL